jgi:lysozyme
MSAQQTFIEKHKEAAIKSTFGKALFPSILMAQAIIESGWGKSELASKHNNYFGIKADSRWNGSKVNYPSPEYINGQRVIKNSYFRSYPDTITGWTDRNNFLEFNSRYHTHGVFRAGTPEEQAKALRNAGYATDPNYVSKLMDVINKYNLKELDRQKDEIQGLGDSVLAFTKKNSLEIIASIVVVAGITTLLIMNKNKIIKYLN